MLLLPHGHCVQSAQWVPHAEREDYNNEPKMNKKIVLIFNIFIHSLPVFAAATDAPLDPGFEVSIQAADAIVEVEIIAGGPYRAVAQVRKTIKGDPPKVFELEGFNSCNWDTVHHGFVTGSRVILFLSRTDRPDVWVPLTPAAPRLSVQQDGVLLALGNPSFRIPVKRASLEEGISLLLDLHATNKVPDRAGAFLRSLWDEGEIESRYLAVALAGALRDERATPFLIEACKDKLLKLRLIAIEALEKIHSTEALNALRALLRDEKPMVSRQAAQALVNIKDIHALTDLLEWIQRSPSLRARAAENNSNKVNDTRVRLENTAMEIIKYAAGTGPLTGNLSTGNLLIDIARSANRTIASEALRALSKLAQAQHVTALLELAEDNTFELHLQAAYTLQCVVLKSFKGLSEFRSWWAQAQTGFGEDFKRDVVEAAAKTLAQSEYQDDRRTLLELIRNAPGEIALVSAAPLLMKQESCDLFSAKDLTAWNSALAVPFLIERLGCDNRAERHDALEGLVRLCEEHPRFNALFWPLIRAGLAEEDIACRRTAQMACGTLVKPDGIPALLDAIHVATQHNGKRDEGQDAVKSLYAFTARTLGFSIYEHHDDQVMAEQRLRGWWKNSRKSFVPVPMLEAQRMIHPGMPTSSYSSEILGERAAKLENLALDNDSRASAAAFALLYAERGFADPLWKKMVAQNRQRNRALGLLGVFGGDLSLAPDLVRRMSDETNDAEAPLCRALSMIALSTLKGGNGSPGAAKIVEWLQGTGASAGVNWRRLAIACLGLADGENQSLAFLLKTIQTGLAAKVPDTESFFSEKPSDDFLMLRPALIALCARDDTTSLLQMVLDQSKDGRTREIAARALSIRRHRPAVAGILKAIDQSDRSGWADLCLILEPLLQPADGGALCTLLENSDVVPRSAAAYLLSIRPELGPDPDVRAHLISGLSDRSSVVRYFCAVALGKRHAASSLQTLVGLLNDEDDDVRAASAQAIGEIGDKEACSVAAEAATRLFRMDQRWMRVLAIAGSEVQVELLIKLCDSNLFAEQRAGLEALSASALPVALPRLLKAFRNDESTQQTLAMELLANRGQQVVDALQDDLKSNDRSVRVRAVYLLSRVSDPSSRAALTYVFNNDDEASVRALAEFAIRRAASESRP